MVLQPLNILITSVSSKMALVRAFTELPMAMRGRLIGIDADPEAPASSECDAFYPMPADTDPMFDASIRDVVAKESVGLVIPTREAELVYWSNYASNLSVVTASAECLDIVLDKWKTFHWLTECGLPTPQCLTKEAAVKALKMGNFPFPWVAKDPLGAGASGVLLIASDVQVSAIPEHWLIQPKLLGKEYTINLYVDKAGQCRCIVPHRRDKIVGGEVYQGQTVDEPVLVALAKQLIGALPPVYGPLNFQVFWQGGDAEPWITDINPRFGGGYLLCHAAGGRFAHWLVEEACGHTLDGHDFAWQSGLRLDRSRNPAIF